LVLLGMQNRTTGTYLAAMDRILIHFWYGPVHHCSQTQLQGRCCVCPFLFFAIISFEVSVWSAWLGMNKTRNVIVIVGWSNSFTLRVLCKCNHQCQWILLFRMCKPQCYPIDATCSAVLPIASIGQCCPSRLSGGSSHCVFKPSDSGSRLSAASSAASGSLVVPSAIGNEECKCLLPFLSLHVHARLRQDA
jgi:hypothetical protein